MSATIKEIFSSIQGEGPYIGERQIFVRFCNCNLNCQYCDTNFKEEEYCQVEKIPGSNNFEKILNPIAKNDLITLIENFDIKKHHSISLTGGEPLLYTDFLKKLLPELNIKIYLETNGTMPNELKEIIDLIDIISMDIKLPSSTGLKGFEQEHLKFIKIAKQKEVFAKTVITSKTTNEELEFLNKVSNKIPLIIQPITTYDIDFKVTPQKLFYILDKVPKARVIPQTHNYIGIL